MKVQVNGSEVRIFGERGVDLRISANSEKDLDRFILSLCYDGFEHGVLPMIEIAGGHIVVQQNMEKGRILLK